MEDTQNGAGENPERKTLIDVSVEGWRFARVFSRLLGKLDAGEARATPTKPAISSRRSTTGSNRSACASSASKASPTTWHGCLRPERRRFRS